MEGFLLDDLLHFLEKQGDIALGDHHPEVLSTVEGLALPGSIDGLLRHGYWPSEGFDAGTAGPHTLFGLRESVEDLGDLAAFARAQMFPIGAAPNGDPLVLMASGDKVEVGLVSHDLFWEDEVSDPSEAYVMVASSLEEYLWRIVEKRYLPLDYYAAKELAQLRTYL